MGLVVKDAAPQGSALKKFGFLPAGFVLPTWDLQVETQEPVFTSHVENGNA